MKVLKISFRANQSVTGREQADSRLGRRVREGEGRNRGELVGFVWLEIREFIEERKIWWKAAHDNPSAITWCT